MYRKQIDAYFADQEAELIAAVSRLVAVPSVKGPALPGKPFGAGPAAALEEALRLCADWNLPARNLSGYVGVADLNDLEDGLHILAHLDVVEPGDGWRITEPYTPRVADGLLYGRGASDDKGPLVAALFALRAVKELAIPLSKNVRVILGTDEESGFGDIKWYYDNYPYAPCTFSPDAGFPLTNLEKGHFQPYLRASWACETGGPRVSSITGSKQVNVVPSAAWAVVSGLPRDGWDAQLSALGAELGITVTARWEQDALHLQVAGKGTHASTPEEGNNALTALIALLCRLPLAELPSTRYLHTLRDLFPHGDHLGQALGIARSDALAGPLTLAFTMLHWEETGFTARFDSRTSLEATEENTLAVAAEALSAHGISLEGHLDPPHHVPADSPFVQTLLRCYEQYTGADGHCLSTGGGTYVHGIPGGVAFGTAMPGFQSGLHGPDERVSIADLLTSCKIFTQAILDLCL